MHVDDASPRYARDVNEAARHLLAGGLVAFPTETVYGLGADASQPAAVARIFEVKRRPKDHPLIVHLARIDDVERWSASFPPFAQRLADLFWPGPLTLVLPRASHVSDAVTGGRGTVALRMPAHPSALALIERLRTERGDALGGVAAPSANRFGAVSPTTAAHVVSDLAGEDVLVLDGGPCEIGLESTIVDSSSPAGPAILRVGGLPRETIEEALGASVPLATEGAARAPGMLAAHYAPRARVLTTTAPALQATVASARARAHRVGLWSTREVDGAERYVPRPRDEREAARTLYATLRSFDEAGCDVVVVELPDAKGLSAAIVDRLVRASRAVSAEQTERPRA